MSTPVPSPASLPTPLSGGGDLIGLAAVGKVAFALLVIVAVILLCAWLLRRLGPGHGTGARSLQIISGKAVGPKEKVVIVDVDGTWLVLGVTAGGISKLHELPAPPAGGTTPEPAAESSDGRFAHRFAAALKQHARDPFGGGRR